MYKHILPMMLYYIVPGDILPYYIILCYIILFFNFIGSLYFYID